MSVTSTCLRYVFYGVGGLTLGVPTIVAAQDAPRPAVRVTGGVEVSSNPFLLEDGPEGIAAFISIDPTLFLEEGRNTTVLDGSVRATQFLNDYGTDVNGRLRLSTQRSLTERTKLSLSTLVTSTRRGFQDGIFGNGGGAVPTDPGSLPDAVLLDPTLIGALVRSTSVGAEGSIDRQLTPVSSLEFGAAYSQTFFSNSAGFDVSSASASLGYNRRLSPQTTVSLSGQFASFNFEQQNQSDANVYSVRASVDREIGTRWSLSAGGGADFIDRDLGLLGGGTDILLAGDVSVCRSGLRSRLCVTGRRAAQPTALAGVSTVISIGAAYDLRLSRTDFLSVNAQFGRSDQDLNNGFITAGSQVDVFGVSANYTHELSDTSGVVLGLGYSGASDDLRDVRANVFARIGITLGFGRQR